MSEAFLDIIKTLPILLLVYALMYYVENQLANTPALLSRVVQFGPVAGALAGTIPQCGFSAAAAALFSYGYLAPATLIAVFLATSDEAVPVLIAGGVGASKVVLLILVKFILAVVGGYILKLSVFRSYAPKTDEPLEIEIEGCGCGQGSPLAAILWRTAKTAFFLFAVLFSLNLLIHHIGNERVASFLLSDSVFQPVLCSILGLVPSCAMSVLLSELYVSGTISFGSLVAGLSTGAGFGYIVLLEEKEGRRRSLPVIASTLAVAIIGGMTIQAFLG